MLQLAMTRFESVLTDIILTPFCHDILCRLNSITWPSQHYTQICHIYSGIACCFGLFIYHLFRKLKMIEFLDLNTFRDYLEIHRRLKITGFFDLGMLRGYLENPQITWNNLLSSGILRDCLVKFGKNKQNKQNKSYFKSYS